MNSPIFFTSVRASASSGALLLLAASFGLMSPASAATFTIGAHHFTVPDGFEIELVAGTNVLQRPVSASFDDQGRLYVTDSSGSNLPPSEQLKNPTSRVLRLEDTDGDGRFDRSIVFADKVMFPQGCLWHAGSVYVAGPPSIWKFTDADGDGVAEARTEWFKGGTLTGCANDIHGPYLGPDGYIYWTKGAFAEQTHPLGNGKTLNDRAAHILKSRPDGSGLEVVMTGGMDNPVEVSFTADGEVVFTSTFIDFSQPGWRDGIGHAYFGAVFGKENDALDDGRVPRTSPEVTHPFVQFGAGAPSGLCRYRSQAFGSEYRDNLFASTFNLHKITRHKLSRSASTYASADSDFVVSDNMDFHPTDVLEDADGSLLIVDTGGWYKLCCPSSQLAKDDILGGIYRVKRKGMPSLSAANRGAAYRALTGPAPLAAGSPVTEVRQKMLKGELTSADGLALLRKYGPAAGESADAAWMTRLGAEAVGRQAAENTSAMVDALMSVAANRGVRDTALAAGVIRALIDIGDAPNVRRHLASDNADGRRAALIALDQMKGGDLKPAEVIPQLSGGSPELARAASWIVGRHADWGSELAGGLKDRLAKPALTADERVELQGQLAKFSRDATVSQLIGTVAADANAPVESRRAALGAMTQAKIKEMPATWTESVVAALSSGNADVLREAVITARALPGGKQSTGAAGPRGSLGKALETIGRDTKQPPMIRMGALASVPGGLAKVDAEIFAFLKAGVAPSQPVALRADAVSTLSRAKLDEEQLGELVDLVKTVGPLELPGVLTAFDRDPKEALGLRLVSALKGAKALPALRPEVLRSHLTNFPTSVQTQGNELMAGLVADSAKQSARLQELLNDVHGKGDVRRGQAIFNSAKAACSTCHAIGYLGGHVGPDLTRISEVRSERDLLESIVFPSASFVRSFEPMLVTTKGGEDVSGIVRKETVDDVTLVTGPSTEVRIARSDIVEMRPGTVSVMPQGLDEQLTRQELADLVAFLRNTKWGAR